MPKDQLRAAWQLSEKPDRPTGGEKTMCDNCLAGTHKCEADYCLCICNDKVTEEEIARCKIIVEYHRRFRYEMARATDALTDDGCRLKSLPSYVSPYDRTKRPTTMSRSAYGQRQTRRDLQDCAVRIGATDEHLQHVSVKKRKAVYVYRKNKRVCEGIAPSIETRSI